MTVRMTSSRHCFIVTAILLLLVRSVCGAPPDLTKYVNALQGTNSRYEFTHGNTFPAAALPFGMNMWTPQTGTNGDGWKYQYFKDTIRGFQQSHQCSSWTNDYAVFSLMPTVGSPIVDENKRATGFRHEDELAKPHYYRVALASGVTVEMSPTERGAYLRFTFPPDKDAYLVLDGYTGKSGVKINPTEGRVSGFVRNGPSQPDDFRNFFTMEFDRPLRGWGTWKKGSEALQADALADEGDGVGAYVQFAPGEVVQLKVASSYVSPEQAERNLTRELGKFQSLEEATKAAKATWNRHLSKIIVEGDDEANKATFYSCLYRASLFPHQFFEYDESGKPFYRSPYDGQIHQGYMYTDTGLWDTFRGQFPLHTILYPQMHGQYMQALLAAYEQCGWLPSWSFPGENGAMIGNHAISLLADAWVKGIRTFDPAQALEAYRHESSAKGPWGPANGRDGWQDFNSLGYVSYPKHGEATAKTLEYAYNDFCGYQLATLTGDTKYAEQLSGRMFNYRNVYDASTDFMRGRDDQGRWSPNFDPTEWGGPFTEGCAWHWQWSVFHDVAGLIQLMGGDQKFIDKLDAVFTQPNTYKVGTYGAPIHEMREMSAANMGQYAHGNQPMQHMLYLYNYAGQPWKTQQHVRDVMDRLYNATENGYPGDEDQGQTSAWYILSSLGFYSVCPGTDEYVLGSPLFRKATITLEDGSTFVVEAKENSKQNVYIQSARLNGEEWSKNYLRHADIVRGGRVELTMGAEPNVARGVAPSDKPYSISTRAAELSEKSAPAEPKSAMFDSWGHETLAAIERDFRLDGPAIYRESVRPVDCGSAVAAEPAYLWSAGVQLSALTAAANANSIGYLRPLTDYLAALQAYWRLDQNGIGGYDVRPLLTQPDRFYDDNAWLALGQLDAYDLTRDAAYRDRAEQTIKFVLRGEDAHLGGGIYWRENTLTSKNTCSNAPTIVAALRLYQITHQQKYLDTARRIYTWTCASLQDPADGLFWDNMGIDGRVDKTKYTYNSALMIRANCLLYEITGEMNFKSEARRIAIAAEALWCNSESGAVRDAGRFAHLLVEAFAAIYALDQDSRWVHRIDDTLQFVHDEVRDPAGRYPKRWDERQTGALASYDLIDQASVARAYLVAAGMTTTNVSAAVAGN